MVTKTTQASGWEWTQAALLVANLGWTTLCLGGYRPETMTVTCALTAMTVLVALARMGFGAAHEASGANPALWFLPFLACAGLNVFFITPVPWLGWLDWLGWANLVAVFGLTAGLRSALGRRVIFFALVLLGLLAVGVACFQRFMRPDWLMLGRTQVEQFLGRASGPFGIPNSLAALLLLLLPACGALTLRPRASAVARVWWGWVTAVFAVGLVLTISRGAWIGLAVALAAWSLFQARWSWARRAGICGATLATCAGAAAGIGMASPHVRERFSQLVTESGELSRPVLWRAAGKLFLENPAVGTGAGSFNAAFERHRPAAFLDEPQWAHNDYLNTLSDYGLIGFGLFFGAVALLAARSLGRAREADNRAGEAILHSVPRGALGIGLLAFALQLAVDFHFKIPALAMACAVCAALAMKPAASAAQPLFPLRRVSLVLSAAVLIASCPALVLLRAETLRYQARQALDRAVSGESAAVRSAVGSARSDLRRAVALWPGHGGAWSDLSLAEQMEAWVVPERTRTLSGPALDAARRAVAVSAHVPEFWVRQGTALDMQGRMAEAEASFVAALRLAPNSVQLWYYYAYHLSLDPRRKTEAGQAVATCLRLDPGNLAAQTLSQRLQ